MHNIVPQKPLAERLRPQNLSEVVGQEHLIAPGAPLYQAVLNKQIPSLILWGPPGVGKTTLARIIGHELGLHFYFLSAIQAGVAEVRKVIEEAKKIGKVLLFLDEIHRFNKSQQDALLGAVENGSIVLIGATTENPSFEVNNALLSRCQVYTLKELTEKQLTKLLKQAIEKDEYLKKLDIHLIETDLLIQHCMGDGRKLLNLLELIVSQSPDEAAIQITNDYVGKILHQKTSKYDKNGEEHYNIISAFIKSIRGSDPNAAVYYLARMLSAGEKPEFIARRLLILASEDIGNANPNALLIANNCFDAVHKIGHPESRIILSQCTIYLACSIKSNASYLAINLAMETVEKTGNLAVPLHLRNAPTKLMKDLNYGKDYAYAHAYEGNFIEQEFLPENIKGMKFFDPGKNPREQEQRQFLKSRWKDKYGY
ncbi:MAG: replication-associated recombination protein A [Bacteroidia bacterium]|nr:replication-associated recombination protein A [Bacteroidia bacterium]